MPSVILTNDLKTVATAQKQADGFLFAKVLSASNSSFKIAVASQTFDVKSSLPLTVGASYYGKIVSKGGELHFIVSQNGAATNSGKANFLQPNNADFSNLPTVINLIASKLSFQNQALTKSLLLASANSTKIKKSYGFKKDGSEIFKAAAVVAFSKKGLVLPQNLASIFEQLLFGLPQGLAESEKSDFIDLIELFNSSQEKEGIRWQLIPFEFESDFSGAFSIGKFQAETVFFNINFMLGSKNSSIHLNLRDKIFLLFGGVLDYKKLSSEIEEILSTLSLKKRELKGEEFFDGFLIYQR